MNEERAFCTPENKRGQRVSVRVITAGSLSMDDCGTRTRYEEGAKRWVKAGSKSSETRMGTHLATMASYSLLLEGVMPGGTTHNLQLRITRLVAAMRYTSVACPVRLKLYAPTFFSACTYAACVGAALRFLLESCTTEPGTLRNNRTMRLRRGCVTEPMKQTGWRLSLECTHSSAEKFGTKYGMTMCCALLIRPRPPKRTSLASIRSL